METNSLISRIEDVIEFSTNGNKKRFSDLCDISKQSLFKWLNGTVTPNVYLILRKFPNVNPAWFIHGVGNMKVRDDLLLTQWPYEQDSEWNYTMLPVANENDDSSCAPAHDIYNDEESRCEDELIDTLKQQVQEKDRQIAMLQKNITDLISNIAK